MCRIFWNFYHFFTYCDIFTLKFIEFFLLLRSLSLSLQPNYNYIFSHEFHEFLFHIVDISTVILLSIFLSHSNWEHNGKKRRTDSCFLCVSRRMCIFHRFNNNFLLLLFMSITLMAHEMNKNCFHYLNFTWKLKQREREEKKNTSTSNGIKIQVFYIWWILSQCKPNLDDREKKSNSKHFGVVHRFCVCWVKTNHVRRKIYGTPTWMKNNPMQSRKRTLHKPQKIGCNFVIIPLMRGEFIAVTIVWLTKNTGEIINIQRNRTDA